MFFWCLYICSYAFAYRNMNILLKNGSCTCSCLFCKSESFSRYTFWPKSIFIWGLLLKIYPPPHLRLSYSPTYSLRMIHWYLQLSTSGWWCFSHTSMVDLCVPITFLKGGFVTTSKYELVGVKVAPYNQKRVSSKRRKTVRMNKGKWENWTCQVALTLFSAFLVFVYMLLRFCS